MSQKAKGWLLVVVALAGVWLIQNGAGTRLTPPGPAAAQAFAAGPALLPGSPVAEPLRPPRPYASGFPASGSTRR